MIDIFWQNLRYVLISGGTVLATLGYVSHATVEPTVNLIMSILGLATIVASAGWGFYVKWRTKAVPIAVAMRADVPTVNAATGQIER